MDQPLLCVMGPTAAGKTDLAIELAERLDGELISVDSALVYRGLIIGAARPTYPHHLIAIRDPAEPYSAAAFVRDARQAVAGVRSRGKLPILVGGTMLYYRALLQGLDEMPASDPVVRQMIEDEARRNGWPALHAELARVDPDLAAELHPNHSQRIGRALEVWRQTGVPMSRWRTGSRAAQPCLAVAICPAQRAWLHRRIEIRLERMFADGLVEEVAALHRREDLNPDLPAIRAVGYRQVWAYLDGETDLDTARARALAATRQLAKRQLSWLRRWQDLVWLDIEESGALCRIRGGSLTWDRDLDTVSAAERLWQNYLLSQYPN